MEGFFDYYLGNQIPRDNKENVNSNEAASHEVGKSMINNYAQDGDGPQPINIRSVVMGFGFVDLLFLLTLRKVLKLISNVSLEVRHRCEFNPLGYIGMWQPSDLIPILLLIRIKQFHFIIIQARTEQQFKIQ